MPKLSLEKLNEIKNSQYLTFRDIAQKTGIPQSTVSKIFGGFNKNPAIDALLKIASALECGIDDFIEYEVQPKSPYYFDRQTAKIAEEIYENPDLKLLFEAGRDLAPDDLRAVIDIAKRIKSS